MTRLIFIRHAESDYSVKDDYSRPLTKSGMLAARKIPELFANTHIDQFYCSPYIRSINTIQYLADQCQKEITLSADLQERKIGIWVEDFSKYSQRQWDDFSYKIENGESLSDVQQRNIKQVNEILNHHQNQTVVIGTHGTALCTILNYYNPECHFEYFQSIAKKMPLFIELQFEGTTFVVMKELYANAFVEPS
jgi:2,3-bisphosphoglycerate-dependent phosphoglycerate mutase